MPKITGLPSDSVIELTDLFPAVSNGATKKVTFQDLLDFLTPQVIAADDGWIEDIHPVPTTLTYLGNRSYQAVYPSSVATYGKKGTRKRFTRTVSAPTQSADLESGSSQYFNDTSVAGTTFTDDFVNGAWIKLESYNGTIQMIESRYNGTSGWGFFIDANGLVCLMGINASATNYRRIKSYQTIPLNKWVHVAAQLDMSAYTLTSTTCYVMIDGVGVSSFLEQNGTNPTALIQAGNLEVGAWNGGLVTFDGKLSQVFYSSAKITQDNVRTLISQGLTASLISTHSIVSAYSLDGSINDLNTTTANNLTAQNSAVATNVDTWSGDYLGGTDDYAVQTSLSSDGLTEVLQVPEGCTLATSGGISAVAYSTDGVPYGFVRDSGRWSVLVLSRTNGTQSSPVANTKYNLGSINITVPIGAWDLGYGALARVVNATNANEVVLTLSQANNTEDDIEYSARTFGTNNANGVQTFLGRSKSQVLSSATVFYLNSYTTVASATNIDNRGDINTTVIKASFAYL